MQLFDQPQAGLLALCAVIFPSTVLLKAPHSWKCVNYRAFTTWFASPVRYWALLCLWYSKWATPKKQAKSGLESCSAEVDPQYPGTAVERLQGIHLRVKTLSKEELSGDWQAGWNVPMPCSRAFKQFPWKLEKPHQSAAAFCLIITTLQRHRARKNRYILTVRVISWKPARRNLCLQFHCIWCAWAAVSLWFWRYVVACAGNHHHFPPWCSKPVGFSLSAFPMLHNICYDCRMNDCTIGI